MQLQDIKELAKLARMQLTDAEMESLLSDFNDILAFVDQIQEVDVDMSAEARLGAIYNVMRDDVDPHESARYTQVLLDEAPDQEDDYLKVKKIL